MTSPADVFGQGPRVRSISDFISEHLRDSGSSLDMNVDGSTTPVEFSWTPNGTRTAVIARIIIALQEDANFIASGYGAGAALANGILFAHRDADSNDTDLLDGVPIQRNFQWTELSYDGTLVNFNVSGGNLRSFIVRWTFTNSGEGLFVYPGESLVMTVRDNLTALDGQRALVQGRYL